MSNASNFPTSADLQEARVRIAELEVNLADAIGQRDVAELRADQAISELDAARKDTDGHGGVAKNLREAIDAARAAAPKEPAE